MFVLQRQRERERGRKREGIERGKWSLVFLSIWISWLDTRGEEKRNLDVRELNWKHTRRRGRGGGGGHKEEKVIFLTGQEED